ncbi:MAG: hypothetical protein M5R36_29235 [Deltaproteobacteria bacterium]|nr:hypothetical protein [Deltaproteobacteria bacterium]
MADEPRNSSIVDDKTALEALSDFIQSIGGTIVNIKRYPTGSSIIDMALERCMASLDRLFRDYASFTLSESERLLVVDAETLPEKYQARAFVRSFIDSMIARNIRSMSFERGLTHEEILAFLKLVGEKPEDLKQRGRLPDLIKDAGVTHVSIDQKVFVAVTSEERVAKLSDLERLAKSGSDDVDPGEFREGQFLSHMIAKLPFDELGISPDQVDSLKKHIDFDRLKNAREVDFEKLGAYLARAMDQMSGADKVDDEAIADPAAKVTKELRQVDTRAGRIVETFVEISETILRFQHPEIRARLLAHFIKIITNFKELTLAKILTARLADSEDLDIKGQILSQISAKKKSRVIDLLLRKYVRLIEGLTADDFEMEPQGGWWKASAFSKDSRHREGTGTARPRRQGAEGARNGVDGREGKRQPGEPASLEDETPVRQGSGHSDRERLSRLLRRTRPTDRAGRTARNPPKIAGTGGSEFRLGGHGAPDRHGGRLRPHQSGARRAIPDGSPRQKATACSASTFNAKRNRRSSRGFWPPSWPTFTSSSSSATSSRRPTSCAR